MRSIMGKVICEYCYWDMGQNKITGENLSRQRYVALWTPMKQIPGRWDTCREVIGYRMFRLIFGMVKDLPLFKEGRIFRIHERLSKVTLLKPRTIRRYDKNRVATGFLSVGSKGGRRW